jgi:hypothetical protein
LTVEISDRCLSIFHHLEGVGQVEPSKGTLNQENIILVVLDE